MKRAPNSHRWTHEELENLILLWMDDDKTAPEIADVLQVSVPALNKVVCRLRNSGIPMKYKKRGNKAGRTQKLWSHSEVEYLLRRRKEGINVSQIAAEMNRTAYAVSGMIDKLRRIHGVPVTTWGQGRKALYDLTALKAAYFDTTSPLTVH